MGLELGKQENISPRWQSWGMTSTLVLPTNESIPYCEMSIDKGRHDRMGGGLSGNNGDDNEVG